MKNRVLFVIPVLLAALALLLYNTIYSNSELDPGQLDTAYDVYMQNNVYIQNSEDLTEIAANGKYETATENEPAIQALPNGGELQNKCEIEEGCGAEIIVETLIERINLDMPQMRFDFTLCSRGWAAHLNSIEISWYETGEIIQEIDLDILLLFGYDIADLNFDGYKDLVIKVHPGSAGVLHVCFLYNPEENQFIFSLDLSLFNLRVDEENQVITSSEKLSGATHCTEYYRYVDGKLTMFKIVLKGVSDEWDIDSSEITHDAITGRTHSRRAGDFDVTFELSDGRWIETDISPTSLVG